MRGIEQWYENLKNEWISKSMSKEEHKRWSRRVSLVIFFMYPLLNLIWISSWSEKMDRMIFKKVGRKLNVM